ncbi:uncharacterized protein LOC113315822 [Papaver somniferum]|uniref:uncharacterized protein LOC113315822 n=1 Tax=Papaver somniferum TaxID=3469 RepID=UPI000E7014FC|nr:uncharacterized protein LOC113315822 [Papaver somniferum]
MLKYPGLWVTRTTSAVRFAVSIEGPSKTLTFPRVLQAAMQNLHRIVSRISSISPFTTRSSIPWRNCSTISSGNPYIDTASEHDSWENFGSSSDPDFDSVFSFPTELTGERSNEMVSLKLSRRIEDKQVRGDTYWDSILSRSNGLTKEQQVNGKKTSGNSSRTSSTLSSSSLNEGGEFGMVEEVFDDALKDEMYKLHKENPEVYTIKKLAIDYGIMVQRVSAILFLKEIEEEEEEMKKLGRSLDDYVEMLLDVFPEFFDPLSNKEFNVSSLPNECDLTVMHEGWDELLEILKKCAMKYQSRRMKCCVKN